MITISEILSKKWSMVVIYYLLDGPKRFSELEGLIEGVSPKVLADTLFHLKRFGIVERIVFDTRPVMVKYRLTDKGLDLGKRLMPLVDWVTRWGGDG